MWGKSFFKEKKNQYQEGRRSSNNSLKICTYIYRLLSGWQIQFEITKDINQHEGNYWGTINFVYFIFYLYYSSKQKFLKSVHDLLVSYIHHSFAHINSEQFNFNYFLVCMIFVLHTRCHWFGTNLACSPTKYEEIDVLP